MDNLYDMMLEDGRIEYYKVKIRTKKDGKPKYDVYNFVNINNAAKFICDFLDSFDYIAEYDEVLSELELTDQFVFHEERFNEDIQLKCSLYLKNFEG